jgi:hypothetical protein
MTYTFPVSSMPGPSRRITVEPIRMPRHAPPPAVPPRRLPERERPPVRVPAPVR